MSDYLPLETWRREFASNPYHFWQLANDYVPVNSKCNGLVREYAWQSAQAVGRNEIRDAIAGAQERITQLIGYSPIAHYVQETLVFPKYKSPLYDRIGYAGSDSRWTPIQLKEKKLIAAGVEAFTSIDDPAPVFTDSDGDSVMDTFTLTFATTITDESEIAVYIPAADRLDGESQSDRWRILPVKVSINTVTGICTVVGKCWQIVRPVLYEGASGTNAATIDPNTLANYCATLEVYRRYTLAGYNDDDCQASLIWESRPYPWYATAIVNSTDPAATATAKARVSLRDAENGIVGIGEAIYDSTTGTWAGVSNFLYWYNRYPPDRIVMRYKAGVPLNDVRMQKIVARLSAAELGRPICACQEANREVYNWQEDMSRTGGNNSEQFTMIPADDLYNPLGTRRGHIFAWKEIKSNLKLSSFST